jgi:ribose transport system substrate-binding protein
MQFWVIKGRSDVLINHLSSQIANHWRRKMKTKVSLIMIAALLVSFVAGCTANTAVAPTTAAATAAVAAAATLAPNTPEAAVVATTAPTAMATSNSGNPLAGKAVDKNGQPLLLGYVGNENSSGWMSNANGYVKSLWERAGGKVVQYISDYDLNKETSMMDDLMQMKPAAILIHPSDSAAIAPSVQKALDAGIPVFAVDMGVTGAQVVSYVHVDQAAMGAMDADYIRDHFSADKPAKVLELTGSLDQNGAQLRQKGFDTELKKVAYATIVQTIDTQWKSDVAFTAVQDAFQRNPDINVIYSHSDFFMQGILQGLQSINKLVPAGQAGHIMVLSIDADQVGLKGIRDGYIDADVENNPVLSMAISVNAILANNYGQSVKNEYLVPLTMATKDNVDATTLWANLPSGQFDAWPVAVQTVFPVPSR